MTRIVRCRLAVCVLLFPLLCLGCTGETSVSPGGDGAGATGRGGTQSTGDNRPAVVRAARLSPDPVTRTQPISVAVEAEDPDGGAVTFRHQWYLNGEPLDGQTGPTLSPELVSRDDRVSVEITPMDAKGAGIPFRTPAAIVVNAPPRVTRLEVRPFPARVGVTLTAEVQADDPDGDEVSYTFRWFLNGEETLEADENTMSTRELSRGDEIALEVTPFDGLEAGPSMRSRTLTIENTPPDITSKPPTRIDDGVYAYTIAATDRDGDALTYALESGPPGMTIDPETGRLTWPIPKDAEGSHQVRVTVSDGQSDEPTLQEFDLTLRSSSGGS